MRRIAIINQKGGAGKTTTTVSLGAALAEQGKQVLIVDLDPQFSTTTWLAIHPVGRGIFDLFAETEKTDLKTLIQPTTTPNLSLVGSSAWLVGAEKALASEPGAEIILREKLTAIEGMFEYVLIDCPPGLGILSVNALTAVNETLVPVGAQVMHLQGLAQLQQTIELVRKRLNPMLHISGVLACRVDQRTNHGPEVVETLRMRFPQTFRTFIRENTKLGECPSHGESILSYAVASSGAEDYRALAKEVMNQEGGEYAKAAIS